MKHSPFAPLLLALALAGSATAQDFHFQFSGTIGPQMWVDTRQMEGAREDMLDFYPKPIARDALNRDTNAAPMLNMLAITNRLAVAVWGPDVLGAKTRGYIETDFTGSSDAGINGLRLRHGYINLDWAHTTLLVGHYWHPMVVHEIMPGTRPLNMGAPFHPYSRYNQVRLEQFVGPLQAIVVAGFQRDNTSQGPNGRSTTYLKHSLVPELNGQLRYSTEKFMLGTAAHLISIKPRLMGNNVSHVSFAVYGRLDLGQWSLKAQSLLNSNLYEYSSMGGYIEHTALDANNQPVYSYDTYTYNTVWLDLGRTTGRWRPGLLLGYAANNNAGQVAATTDHVYGRGLDIDYLYRIQPRIGYMAGGGLSLYAEVEHTFAAYRSGGVSGTRFIVSANYAFKSARK